jgi:hypothetical protein
MGERLGYTYDVFAGVAEWHTRTSQKRVGKPLRVQLPPPALKISRSEIFVPSDTRCIHLTV